MTSSSPGPARMSRRKKWFLIIFAGPGILCLFVVVPGLIIDDYLQTTSNTSDVTGDVVSVRDRSYRGSRGCEVEYVVDDVTHRLGDTCSAGADTGDRVRVFYNDETPGEGSLSAPERASTGLVIGLGGCVAMLALGILGWGTPTRGQGRSFSQAGDASIDSGHD